MFYIIGLGLGDAKDVTVKGLEIIKQCTRVYLEAYTSILTVGKESLEEFYGRPLIVADRTCVEEGADDILEGADKVDVGFLVVGDPFGATTHTDLILRAKEKGIAYKVIHNASIMNAVGCCGLQLYSFGETISIPFWTETWMPDSFYEKIAGNKSRGLHTLCLLDIKVKEPTPESLTKKKKEYMPPTFMSVSQACKQLLQILEKKHADGDSTLAYQGDSVGIGLAKVGSPDQKIVCAPISVLAKTDLGPPLHCMIIPGNIQPLEAEFLSQFCVPGFSLNNIL